ncbi:MAG TPA: hypothetical protein VML95_04270 [Longimicrobiales bacterium]|nr:hypothetical protein [Longimicrobiales bacterium]
MRTHLALRGALAAALVLPAPALGQAGEPPRPDGASVISYAKWGALGAAVTAGVIGFSAHRDADELFTNLEALCEADAARCVVGPAGSYLDADLEGRYRDVLDADSRARTALIVSQVAVAASLALFLLDLGGDSEPDNVPYDPDRGFGFRSGADGRTEFVYVMPWKGF